MLRFLAALCLVSCATHGVEYVNGETITYSDGWQVGGVYLTEFNVLAVWTSKASADGPIYGISILRRTDIKSRKPLLGKGGAAAYPVSGAVFEPETEMVLASDRGAEVLTIVGLKGEPAEQAEQARTRIAAIKAAAMKLIKP